MTPARTTRAAASGNGAARPSPRSKRELILATATADFARIGYRASRWSDVADAVGIGSTALYHYFVSKEHCLFRIMADAEPRPSMGKLVEWKFTRTGDGKPDPIQPAPVQLEIVEFPGGVDILNPKFFQDFHCPATAIQ